MSECPCVADNHCSSMIMWWPGSQDKCLVSRTRSYFDHFNDDHRHFSHMQTLTLCWESEELVSQSVIGKLFATNFVILSFILRNVAWDGVTTVNVWNNFPPDVFTGCIILTAATYKYGFKSVLPWINSNLVKWNYWEWIYYQLHKHSSIHLGRMRI